MKHSIVVLLIFIVFVSCKDQKEVKDKHQIIKSVTNSEESINIIENSREFELKNNDIFQQSLEIKSLEYYNKQTELFIDNETGFFKLFSELWNKQFKSDNEIKLLWKLKIERHFRTSSYFSYMIKEVRIYTDGVNNQRNNGIVKILGTNHSSNLNLPILDSNSFIAKSDSVENIINKINEEIKDQLADMVLGFTPEIILFIFGTFGFLQGFKIHWSISVIILIIIGGLFFWRSNIREDEIRNILKIECSKVLENTQFNYLEKLDKNTNDYYNKLLKINYETNK